MLTQESVDGRTVGTIWAAKIWTPLVKTLSVLERRLAKTVGSTGAADRGDLDWDSVLSELTPAAMFCSAKVRTWFMCPFVHVTVLLEQRRWMRRCEGCSDHGS